MAKSFVNFKTANKFVQAMILQEIDAVIRMAGKYGGRVRGDYLYNVLIPRELDPTCKVVLPSVSIGFPDHPSQLKFEEELVTQYQRSANLDTDLDVVCTLVSKYGTGFVSIILHNAEREKHPLYDTLGLGFSYDSDGKPQWSNQTGTKSVESLKNQILQKKAEMSPKRVETSGIDYAYRWCCHNIRKGWEITFNGHICPASAVVSIDAFTDWVEMTQVPDEFPQSTIRDPVLVDMNKIFDRWMSILQTLGVKPEVDMQVPTEADILAVLDLMQGIATSMVTIARS